MRRFGRKLKQAGPKLVLALLVVFAGVSFWQVWDVASYLRGEARETSRIYGRLTAALGDPRPEANAEALLDLLPEIRGTGIPMVVTNEAGQLAAAANTPFDERLGDPAAEDAIADYVQRLDRTNPPVSIPGLGQIHYGALPVLRRLTWMGLLQLGILVAAVAIGAWAYGATVRRQRDLLWVAMARESAHQLGTPLMSASAWVERLADGTTAPEIIADHLEADLERLQRVVQRFERIGRPARRAQAGLGALAERVATYFQPRLPRHAHPVVLTVNAPVAGPMIDADPVLLEWAIEALVRNALDALSGRGGNIEITVRGHADHAVITVADDGPGIPPAVRSTLFDPGVSTKPGGWGIGLALARRIVEDVHGGKLELDASARGTVFLAELPVAAAGIENTEEG